jgi:hypothetical protein
VGKPATTYLTAAAVEARRAQVYRRTSARRVRTIEEAERFVAEMGFCFFWPIKGVEMPSLFHAIAGRERDVPMAHDDPDLSKSWNWKDQSLGTRRWYYGKVLSRRATLIARDYLPVFYALSPNYGGETDYLDEYEAGLLSREARGVFEALRDKGPLDTVRLRRECGLASDSAKAGFERALVDLQIGMKVLPVGVAEAGAWHYAFIYDLVGRHFPEAVEQARGISRSEARASLIERYVRNVVATPQAALRKVFGVLRWTPAEMARTLDQLVEQGRVTKLAIDGTAGEQLVSPQTLAEMPSRQAKKK